MYVIDGIRDYIKDCRHDRLCEVAAREYDQWAEIEGRHYIVIPCGTWKEGSVWHYIMQRKIAKRMKHV